MNSLMNFSYSTMIHRVLHLLVHNGLYKFINELLIFYDDPQTVTLTASPRLYEFTNELLIFYDDPQTVTLTGSQWPV